MSSRLLQLKIALAVAFASIVTSQASAGVDVADLSVVVDDGVTIVEPNGPIAWTITVQNAGPDDAIAQVSDAFPVQAVGVTWTCAPEGSAICAASGNGAISDLVFIPSGDAIVYAASATVDAALNSTISNTAIVGTLDGIIDPDSDNNVSTDTDTVAYTESPVVEKLDSVATPYGSCGLPDGVESKASVTQVVIDFSQPMSDPMGDSDPVDVTNTANYRVLEAGADHVFSTADCTIPPGGDDRVVTISHIDYDANSNRAALHVDANMMALSAGSYRVIACGSGLANPSGMLLDGAGNGVAGSDFRSDFRILGTNLLVNPNFDHPLANGWETVGGAGFVVDDVVDADAFSSSGSISAAGTGGQNLIGVILQCVPGITGGYYSLSARDLNFALPGELIASLSSDACDSESAAILSNYQSIAVPGQWNLTAGDTARVSEQPTGTSVQVAAGFADVALGTTVRMDSWSLRREDDDIIFRTGVDFPNACTPP